MYGNWPVKSPYAVSFSVIGWIVENVILHFSVSCCGKKQSLLSLEFVLCFVDCKFFLSWFKCPKCIGMLFPTNFLKFNFSIPGHVMKWSFAIAFTSVEITGINSVPWKNCARSVLFLSTCMMTFICCCSGFFMSWFCVFFGFVSFTSYSPSC